MRTEKLNSVLLSTLLVTSLMVPLLTMVLISVPQASSQPPGWADHVVISEVFYDESGTDFNEFVELYNPTSSSVDISGWMLRHYNQTETLQWTLTFAPGTTIDSHGYYLIGQKSPLDSADWGGTPITPDAILPGSIQNGPGDYVTLENSYVDGVRWGTKTSGADIPDDPNYADVSSGSSIERKSGPTHDETQGNGYDTDDASNDFRTRTTPNPQNTMSPIEPEENIKYLDNLYWLDDPIWSHLHELYPTYSRSYLLTSWVDTNEDAVLSPSDKIDITDGNGEVTWWHVDNVTITMLVENLENIEQIMYIELDPELFPIWYIIKTDPISSMWHEIWPVFSRWYHLSSWDDTNGSFELDFCDVIDITDEFEVVSWWHVLEVKYDIIVSRIPPPKYLDNLRDLYDPISSQLHELYPEFSRQYDLTSWVDTDGDSVLSQNDIIDLTDENEVVTWWNVDTVTITMLVENVENKDITKYIELDPSLFPFWDSIKLSPISTWWHEIWPVFSRWYHLSSWSDDNADGELGPSDVIDITDEFEAVSWWHVVDSKYDIIVQELPPLEEYIKENMPDLGQHSVNWCWTAAAANSIKWYAHHGYPELLDDPSDNVLDDNYLQIIPWLGPPPCPSPEGGFLRLLHEIAIDGLFPGAPDNEVPENATFCNPITNDLYFYGLQEFINEQGAPLYVHEIVDNDHFGGVGIPPEDGENVIYDQPTFENYKTELERSQDVLLQLDFRNFSNEIYEPEAMDHIVTGVSFFDAGPGAQLIQVSDPWTQFPVPFPGPDHNNLENRYTYDNLPVVNEDPLTVLYTGENLGGPVQVPVQVVKLIYVSPEVPEVPWTGTATFSLKNLYTVNVEKILDLNQGSKLVVKFYTYGDVFENENVVETFSPPAHVEENELARHPGPGRVGVKKARLDQTTNDTSDVISTIASFTVTKTMLEIRFTDIPLEWALAPPAEKTELEIEFSEIPLYWALAPS